MTALLTFLRMAWPYLLTAAIAGFISHAIDSIPYNRLETSFASYKAQVADADALAQKAATDALQAQIQTRLTTEANNGKVISQLTQERDSAAIDRDLARRLLAAAQARPTSGSGAVPQAADRSSIAPAGPAISLETLTSTCADVGDEDDGNARQLNALIAELVPQLK